MTYNKTGTQPEIYDQKNDHLESFLSVKMLNWNKPLLDDGFKKYGTGTPWYREGKLRGQTLQELNPCRHSLVTSAGHQIAHVMSQ